MAQLADSPCHAGDPGSIPGLGRSPGEGTGYPLQYSGLEDSVDCIVLEVVKSWIWLSDFHCYTTETDHHQSGWFSLSRPVPFNRNTMQATYVILNSLAARLKTVIG